VVTPDGVLFEKEAILECLLNQKKEYVRKRALYESQLSEEVSVAAQAAAAAEEARLEDFHRMNHGGGGTAGARGSGAVGGGAVRGAGSPEGRVSGGASSVAATAFQAEQARGLKAFWMPGQTPDTGSKAAKPSADTLCPSTGKKLRMKDLTPVRFTRCPGEEQEEGGRFMCPTCKEVRFVMRVCAMMRGQGRSVAADGLRMSPLLSVRRRRSRTCLAWLC
jgi:nitric oxide synthase-interacting protein